RPRAVVRTRGTPAGARDAALSTRAREKRSAAAAVRVVDLLVDALSTAATRSAGARSDRTADATIVTATVERRRRARVRTVHRRSTIVDGRPARLSAARHAGALRRAPAPVGPRPAPAARVGGRAGVRASDVLPAVVGGG